MRTKDIPEPKISPSWIIQLRKKLRLRKSEFARATGGTPAMVWAWETGLVSPTGPARKLMEYLDQGRLRLNPNEFKKEKGRKPKVI